MSALVPPYPKMQLTNDLQLIFGVFELFRFVLENWLWSANKWETAAKMEHVLRP